MPPHPLSDPRTRSLIVDAGMAAGRITVVYRRSHLASALDDRDPSNPIIVLNPDEHPEVLMAEVAHHCATILERAEARERYLRAAGGDIELVHTATTGELALASSGDAGPATDLSARTRRRSFGLINGG